MKVILLGNQKQVNLFKLAGIDGLTCENYSDVNLFYKNNKDNLNSIACIFTSKFIYDKSFTILNKIQKSGVALLILDDENHIKRQFEKVIGIKI